MIVNIVADTGHHCDETANNVFVDVSETLEMIAFKKQKPVAFNCKLEEHFKQKFPR